MEWPVDAVTTVEQTGWSTAPLETRDRGRQWHPAISVPVQAGYGLPFSYFLLHALAMHLETTPPVRRVLQSRVAAHLWTAAWILLPLPLLFHWPFCAGVLLPLLASDALCPGGTAR